METAPQLPLDNPTPTSLKRALASLGKVIETEERPSPHFMTSPSRTVLALWT